MKLYQSAFLILFFSSWQTKSCNEFWTLFEHCCDLSVAAQSNIVKHGSIKVRYKTDMGPYIAIRFEVIGSSQMNKSCWEYSGDLRPGSSVFWPVPCLLFDMKTQVKVWIIYFGQPHPPTCPLTTPRPHPCSCTERGVFFVASVSTLGISRWKP